MGIKVWRFYLKCTTCLAELTFKTDPKRNDYTVENGATRNFEPWKQRNTEEELEKAKRAREEMGDTMKVLENRTEASKREMDLQDAIEEVKELNARSAQLTTDQIIDIHSGAADRWEEAQIEAMAAKAFAHKQNNGGSSSSTGKSAAAMPDPDPLSQFAAAGSSSAAVAAPAASSSSSLRLLNRLPDAVDLSAVDYRPSGGAAALDQLEVPDSPTGDGGSASDNAATAAAAASSPAAAAAANGSAAAAASASAASSSLAAPSAASVLPAAAPLAGLVLIPKKRKPADGDKDHKKKSSKKDRKEQQKTNEQTAQAEATPGLGGLLGSYGDDSD